MIVMQYFLLTKGFEVLRDELNLFSIIGTTFNSICNWNQTIQLILNWIVKMLEVVKQNHKYYVPVPCWVNMITFVDQW